MRPVLARMEDGSFTLLAWPARSVRAIEEAVVLACPEFPSGAARDRILQPSVVDDEEEDAEWRRRVHPELAALFESARAIVAADLATAVRSKRGGIRHLTIPADHVPAWIATVHTAIIRLAAEHGVDSAAMDNARNDPEALSPELWAALVKIEFLSEIESSFVELGNDDAEPPAGTSPDGPEASTQPG